MVEKLLFLHYNPNGVENQAEISGKLRCSLRDECENDWRQREKECRYSCFIVNIMNENSEKRNILSFGMEKCKKILFFLCYLNKNEYEYRRR